MVWQLSNGFSFVKVIVHYSNDQNFIGGVGLACQGFCKRNYGSLIVGDNKEGFAFIPLRVKTERNFRKERATQDISIVAGAHGIEGHRTKHIPRGHLAYIIVADDTIYLVVDALEKNAPAPLTSDCFY